MCGAVFNLKVHSNLVLIALVSVTPQYKAISHCFPLKLNTFSFTELFSTHFVLLP